MDFSLHILSDHRGYDSQVIEPRLYGDPAWSHWFDEPGQLLGLNVTVDELDTPSGYGLSPLDSGSTVSDFTVADIDIGTTGQTWLPPTPGAYVWDSFVQPMPAKCGAVTMNRTFTASSGSSVGSDPDTDREKGPYRCTVCNTGFEHSRDLERHGKLLEHKPYQCPECPKSYYRRDVYLRHKITHKDGGHVCKYCYKVSKRRDHYLQHIRSCHSDKDLPGPYVFVLPAT
jgi:hypothetical protein